MCHLCLDCSEDLYTNISEQVLPRDNKRSGGVQSLMGGEGPAQMQPLCFRMAKGRMCTVDLGPKTCHGSAGVYDSYIAFIVLWC